MDCRDCKSKRGHDFLSIPDQGTSFIPPDQGSGQEENGRADGSYSDSADGH